MVENRAYQHLKTLYMKDRVPEIATITVKMSWNKIFPDRYQNMLCTICSLTG